MRPAALEEFVGQEHFLGEDKLLRRLLKADRLGSVIFYGPPGTGKTTLARLLARESRSVFHQLSAVTAGVKDLREMLTEARDRLSTSGQRTLLFVDEIHRFNKAQQDVLLPDVEEGIVVLVGATTENPFFTINSALVSRSRIFQFQPLSADEIKTLLRRALADQQRGLGRYQVVMREEALDFLAQVSDGDARQALSALEIGVLSSNRTPVDFTRQLAEESVQRKAIDYDRQGDAHYDTISALIKSIRGSDPDAALYWLARMLEGGEDVRFLARRIVILASEDVGNADPAALPLAVAAAHACELVGLPECQLALAQAVTYLACAPKSNAATVGIGEARQDIREGRTLPVPVRLRDSHYPGAQRLGHGEGYLYAHDQPEGVASQDYLGVTREYYRPTDRGFERELAVRLEAIRSRLRAGRESGPPLPPEEG
jgi:putative ATPase